MAAPYELAKVGTLNQQWENVFVKGGPFGNQVQPLDHTESVQAMVQAPTPHQGGGKKRSSMRRHKKSSKARRAKKSSKTHKSKISRKVKKTSRGKNGTKSRKYKKARK